MKTDGLGGQTGGRPRPVVNPIARRSGGGDGSPRRRLGGQAEGREEPAHRVGRGHHAHNPARHSGTDFRSSSKHREVLDTA
jgi:hypothetical protein